MEEYLPPVTKQWCEDRVIELGFGEIDGRRYNEVGERLHKMAYVALRDAVIQHISVGNVQPTLEESAVPAEPDQWYRQQAPLREELERLRQANRDAGYPMEDLNEGDDVPGVIDADELRAGEGIDIDPVLL